MKGNILLTGLLVFAPTAVCDTPPAGNLPAPPSVAINPVALDASADVKIWVNVIPADAKYVIHARLGANGPRLSPEEAAATGANLSGTVEPLSKMARERGANLVVFLGAAHGIDVPIQQAAQPLRLRADDPSVTVVLFRRAKLAPPTAAETAVRFTTLVAPGKGENRNYKINLQSAPPGLEMATWAYGNIARFVADATQHGFDTIALRSTTDAKFENVWLPGCDDPLRVSLVKPELDVTIYKGAPPNPSAP